MKAKILKGGAGHWLVQKAKRKDPQAFAELWRQNRQHLRNFLGKRIISPEMREDVEQQTALQAWRCIGKFRANGPFHYWLFSIALNEWRMILRKDKKHPTQQIDGETIENEKSELIPQVLWQDYKPEGRLIAKEGLKRVARGVRRMGREYSEVWWGRSVMQLSTAEVASVLKISGPAVKSRYHRAQAVMKRVVNG